MRPYLAGTALAAVCLTLSQLHRLHSADSLVFSLASLYEWTPFFWEQDRVGLLIPLLASPVRHPLANELVITGMMCWCGLTTPLLMARLVCPTPAVYAAVTLGNALFVLLAPDLLHENMFVVCNYPCALVLGLTAVVLLDSPGWERAMAAVALLVLAHWVYLGVAVFLAGFVAARWLMHRDRGSFFAFVRCVIAVGLAVGLILRLMAAWRASHPEVADTLTDGRPLHEWLEGLTGFAQSLANLDGFTVWAAVVGGLSLSGCLAGLVRDRAAVARAAGMVAPLLVAAAFELVFLASRGWTAVNLYHSRYLVAVVTAVWTFAAVVAAAGVGPAGRRAALVTVCFLLAAAVVRHGPPSVTAARAGLDEAGGTDSSDLLASGFEGIGGEYMWAWPAVYHTNLVLYERGERRTVVGVTSRSAPWAWRWRTGELTGGFRVAAPFDQEEQARRWVTKYGLTVVGTPERSGRLVILSVRPAG